MLPWIHIAFSLQSTTLPLAENVNIMLLLLKVKYKSQTSNFPSQNDERVNTTI